MVAYLKIILLLATATIVKSQESKKLGTKEKTFCLAPFKKLTNKATGLIDFDQAPTLQECIKKCADEKDDACLGISFKNPNAEGCWKYKTGQTFTFENNKLALNEFVAFRDEDTTTKKGKPCTKNGFVKDKELCIDTYYNRGKEDMFDTPFKDKSYEDCYKICESNQPKCKGFVVNTKAECYPKKKATDMGSTREAGTVSTRMTC